MTPGRPRLRHEYLAATLAVVATLRLLEGDVAWGAVLGTAALAEAVLAAAQRRAGSRTQHPASAQPSALPDARVLTRSLAVHRRSQRTWLAGVVLCAVAGASVVAAAPSIAVVLGVLSLFALHRLRRERRSVVVLEALRAASLPHLERAA